MYVPTAVWWGPEQAKLKDPRPPRFPLILHRHWMRTGLVTGYGLCFLFAAALRMR